MKTNASLKFKVAIPFFTLALQLSVACTAAQRSAFAGKLVRHAVTALRHGGVKHLLPLQRRDQRILVRDLTRRQSLDVFHRADLVLHQQIIERLHFRDLAPIAARADVELHAARDIAQSGEVKGNDLLLPAERRGDLHIARPVILAHKGDVNAAQVLDALQKRLLRQLHRRRRGALQGDDGARVVRSRIAEGNVRRAEEFLRVADGKLDKLADLRADARRVDDLCHIVHAAVHGDLCAHAIRPFGDLRLVVYDLWVGERHERDHRHGEELVDKDLVRDQSGYHRLPVIAIMHEVPRHPCYGIKRSEERRVGKECRSRWSPYH